MQPPPALGAELEPKPHRGTFGSGDVNPTLVSKNFRSESSFGLSVNMGEGCGAREGQGGALHPAAMPTPVLLLAASTPSAVPPGIAMETSTNVDIICTHTEQGVVPLC